MSIFGHDVVDVTKDRKGRCWHVSTKAGGLLLTVPWTAAFADPKTYAHAVDYAEAVATCQGHESTCLTEEDEELMSQPTTEPDMQNVVSVDFSRRRRR